MTYHSTVTYADAPEFNEYASGLTAQELVDRWPWLPAWMFTATDFVKLEWVTGLQSFLIEREV